MTNIAIVGAGTMGSIHAESFRPCPARTTWIVDPERLSAPNRSPSHSARASPATSPRRWPTRPLDAVLLAVPTPLHRALTEAGGGGREARLLREADRADAG